MEKEILLVSDVLWDAPFWWKWMEKRSFPSQEIPVKRCGICSEGSDRSDQDRDNDRACEEWKHAGGVSKDSTGYSERKDF